MKGNQIRDLVICIYSPTFLLADRPKFGKTQENQYDVKLTPFFAPRDVAVRFSFYHCCFCFVNMNVYCKYHVNSVSSSRAITRFAYTTFEKKYGNVNISHLGFD